MSHVDNGVRGVKVPAYELVGLRYPVDRFDVREGFEGVLEARVIWADDADNAAFGADRKVCLAARLFYAGNNMIKVVRSRLRGNYDYHRGFSTSERLRMCSN
jgi:hypothetical protein